MPDGQDVKAVATDAKEAASEVGKGRPGTIARSWLWKISPGCLILFPVDASYALSGASTWFDRGGDPYVQGLL